MRLERDMAVVRSQDNSHTEDTVFLFSHQARLPLPVPWSFYIVRVPLSFSGSTNRWMPDGCGDDAKPRRAESRLTFLPNGPDSPVHSVLGSDGPQLLWKYYGLLASFRLSESPKLERDSPASCSFQGTKIQIALE